MGLTVEPSGAVTGAIGIMGVAVKSTCTVACGVVRATAVVAVDVFDACAGRVGDLRPGSLGELIVSTATVDKYVGGSGGAAVAIGSPSATQKLTSAPIDRTH